MRRRYTSLLDPRAQRFKGKFFRMASRSNGDSGILPLTPLRKGKKRGFFPAFATCVGGHVPVPDMHRRIGLTFGQTFAEMQIPCHMPQSFAATFEARDRSFCKTSGENAIARYVHKVVLVREHLKHVFRIRLPVRCQPEISVWPERAYQQFSERGLDQTALVVPLLGPRIRKEDVDACKAARRDLVRQHFNRVVGDDLQVRKSLSLGSHQQVSDSCAMDFHSEAVDAGMRGCESRQCIAGSETDFEQARGVAPECRIQVQR